MNTDGKAVTGWKTINGSRYYFIPSSGKMATGFQKISGKTYYFMDKRYKEYKGADEGKLMTGFKTIGNVKYYFATAAMSGYKNENRAVMATGWKTINKKRYHFSSSGVVDVGWRTIDNAKYHFASNGVMHNGWVVIAGKTYHFTGGKMDTGWKTIGGNLYYLHKDGHMQEIGRVRIGGKMCAFNPNGVCTSRNSTIKDVISFASSWVGKIPYKSSVTGNDPNNERSMPLKAGRGSDCSWFVYHCLENYGYLSKFVHSYEWGSKPSCYPNAKEIGSDLSKAKAGDIICYAYGDSTRTRDRKSSNSHVAIYLGNGKQIECAAEKGVIRSSVDKSHIINIVRFN